MTNPLLLSVSLTLLILFHGSLASNHHQSQQQQLNKCQIDRLNALEPTNRVEYEAGEGLTATIIPGCPETFQSPQHGQHGGTFQDHHQQIRRFRAGDILVVPAGVANWTYNDGDTPVIAVNFYDVSNDANQLDNNPRKFYLAGNPREEFQEQQGQQQQWWRLASRGKGQQEQQKRSCNNILCGFDQQILAEAFNVDESLIDKIQNDDRRGGIIKVKGDLQMIKTPRSGRHSSQEESEYESESSKREPQMNGIEETICSVKLRENVGDRSRADIYTPGVGRLVTLKSQQRQPPHPERAIMAPHWNRNAHSIIYGLEGSAQVQVVDNNGNSVFDGELRKGQILTVPQNFAVVKRATGQNFQWVAIKTNENAVIASLTGETSVLRAIPQEVLENAFKISNEEASRLKYSNQYQTTLSSGRRSSQMTADA
ncbi:hypothetical protein EZV62_010817 [Acer yangbiense]|uniref:Cupin type-1 domain-containing protein n=1 Tax=Acer yangbiense TaxID=1000413 RepID=A0A5C7I2S7_9ROSI|nr:hypothetical protein EZV62_010817 [Acer yangbiense]